MSIKKCCSLCCTACSEYKFLQNEKGDSNEIYEITVKYFDPVLLTEGSCKDDQEINVLCHDCWLHISDFHEFQQAVIITRSSLEKYNAINQLELDIKQEIIHTNNAFTEEIDDDHRFAGDFENNYERDCENLPQPNNLINSADNDDEKPLITLKTSIQDRNNNEETNLENVDNQLRVKPKNVAENVPIKRKKLKLTEDSIKDISYYIEKEKETDNIIAEWKPELECDICGETSKSFQRLRQHFKEKHKTSGYIKCCERKFHLRYALVHHIEYHLKFHKKLMDENTKQLECEVCHKMFNLKQNLERHMLTHVTGSKDFVCQECGMAYVLEVHLKSHIKTVHNVNRVCDQCGKAIHGVAALKKHLMEHAGVKRPKFPCNKCSAQLSTRCNLRRHMAAFHHDGSTIYLCGICGKVASSKTALLAHKRNVHEEDRNHKCTYCEKAFTKPKMLREHIATHTGQDLYQCPHCPQTFKRSSDMHHHRKKVHPIEWEEGRIHRLQLPKVNINQVKNQVVM